MVSFWHEFLLSAAWKDFVDIHNALYTAIIFIPPWLVIRYLFRQDKHHIAFKYAIACFLIILFSIGTNGTLDVVDRLTPTVYDPAIYGVEVHTLLNLPWLVKALHFVSVPLYLPLALIYDCLLLLVVIASCAEVLHTKTSVKNNLLIRFAVGGLLSIGLYLAVPAVGPVYYAMGGFPAHMPDVNALTSGLMFFKNQAIHRNSMPSLHATWVILCFLALQNSPFKYRVMGAVYVALTFIFTVGMGYHYLLDWVVALPLVLFIRALVSDYSWRGVRFVSLLWGSMNLLAWIGILRHVGLFINAPIFLNSLILATMIVPIYLERRLAALEDRAALVPLRRAVPNLETITLQ